VWLDPINCENRVLRGGSWFFDIQEFAEVQQDTAQNRIKKPAIGALGLALRIIQPSNGLSKSE